MAWSGTEAHVHQYFSYFVAVSFIGGGNRNNRRKLPTCHWPTSSHNSVSSTSHHERDSNL